MDRIIEVLHGHTLTVILAALTIEATGMDPEFMLRELEHSGPLVTADETVELHKDNAVQDAVMYAHVPTPAI